MGNSVLLCTLEVFLRTEDPWGNIFEVPSPRLFDNFFEKTNKKVAEKHITKFSALSAYSSEF